MSDDSRDGSDGHDAGGLADGAGLEEQRLQAKLEAGTITEGEYARLTALRFGKDPEAFSFADAADFYDLTEAELREEIAWLGGEADRQE